MIDRFLKLKTYVVSVVNNSASQRTKAQKYLLTNEEVETAENMLVVLKPFKVITNMLSHSKLTSSRILACLAYLKTKGLKSKVEDTRDLVQMKLFMLACLDFYVKKYNMFDNILLITATYLDPELKDFEFVEELG